MLGERPIALEKDVLRRRIYAPQAYAPVRNAAVVPIVHSECMALASWFPIAWRHREGALELVVVRALLDDQHAQPAPARLLLPLRLQAYPFIFDPARPVDATSPQMLDDVFADAPTDAGATITNVNQKLGRATTARLAMLDRIAAEAGTTAAIGDTLLQRDLLEPWPLIFNIDGKPTGIRDLLVVRRAAFDDASMTPLIAQYGLPCATLLGLHRISLFRAGLLLAAAKSFISASKAQTRRSSPTQDLLAVSVS
jgi:hypothetical protein